MTKRLPCPYAVQAALLDIAARVTLIARNEQEIKESAEIIRKLIGATLKGEYGPNVGVNELKRFLALDAGKEDGNGQEVTADVAHGNYDHRAGGVRWQTIGRQRGKRRNDRTPNDRSMR